jgi:subtilase family protein
MGGVFRGRSVALLALGFAAFVLGSCGGGGGGGGGGASTSGRPTPAPLDPPAAASTFVTAEFRANQSYGGNGPLGDINAQDAYAQGTTGKGVNVAIVDSGIDPNQPDLKPHISSASTDIAAPGTALNDATGHGTAVAGIIGATKNGVGMHGVAYNATLIAIRADDVNGSGAFSEQNVAAGINYAVSHGAHVINLSLGGSTPNGFALKQALQGATSNGVVVVAVGNDGNSVDPNFPAGFAGTPTGNGALIAVGAVDQNNVIASFSNRCGATANFCLVAPGVDIVTTARGGGYTGAGTSGTSFSTPHVSGAAALLIQLFPNLSAQDVVQILLTSATDLGAAGVDSLYGHGLLNLDAAVQPLGTLAVPSGSTVDGPTTTLSSTMLALGPAFGDAGTGIGLIDQAIIIDGFQRAYKFGMRDRFVATPRDTGLEAMLHWDGSTRISVPMPDGTWLSMTMAEPEAANNPRDAAWLSDTQEGQLSSLDLTVAFSADSAVHVGLEQSPAAQLADDPQMIDALGLFAGAADMVAPQYTLLGQGAGMRFSQALDGDTSLSVGWMYSDGDEPGIHDDYDGGAGNAFQLALAQRLPGGVQLGLTAAVVQESGSFLGSENDGAFDTGDGATNQFYSVSASWPLAENFSVFGSYTMAMTELDGTPSGMLSDWSRVSSDAFGVGFIARELMTAGDRFGFLAGQPLRVNSANATLTVPVGVSAGGAVAYQSDRVDMTPSGREFDLQLAYARPLWDGADLGAWTLLQLDPGQDADAGPGYGGGLRFHLQLN